MISRRTEAWCSKSKPSSVLGAGKAGGPDADLATGALARAHLPLETGDEVLLVAPGFGPGPLAESAGGVEEQGSLARPAEMDEVAARPRRAHEATRKSRHDRRLGVSMGRRRHGRVCRRKPGRDPPFAGRRGVQVKRAPALGVLGRLNLVDIERIAEPGPISPTNGAPKPCRQRAANASSVVSTLPRGRGRADGAGFVPRCRCETVEQRPRHISDMHG